MLFNGEKSDIRDITYGVPQESILGPLLFILYINDFSGVSDKLFCVLFADDTNIFLSGKDIHTLINTLHVELSKLYTWLLANKLTLNISKTHFMVFHRAKHKKYKIIIEINNIPIEQVRHTKFLGVIFDDNLDWSNHISYINTKIAKGIAQQTVGKETIAFGLYFASVFPSSDILNGYVTNTEANDHVALSSHRNSHLYITFFHVL